MTNANRGSRLVAALSVLALCGVSVVPAAAADPSETQLPGSHRNDTPPAKPQPPPAKAPPQPQVPIAPQPPARPPPQLSGPPPQPRVFQPQPHSGPPPVGTPPPVARAPQPDRPRFEPERRGGDRREFGGDRPRYGDRGREYDRGRYDRDDDRRGRIAAAIGAGAIIGSIIAYSAYSGPNREEVYDRCDRDFFDFDYDTGTFENRDGDRETCPYLE